MHALLVRRGGLAASSLARRPSLTPTVRPRWPAVAARFAAAASSPEPPGGPRKKAQRQEAHHLPLPPLPLPPSPTSLLLALQRSERFSRDGELLWTLRDLDSRQGDQPADEDGDAGGPLLALGSRLWLEGVRGRNARRAEVAEALARLAAYRGGGSSGPALFGSVCRAGRVPRRTVELALDVIGVLEEEEEEQRHEEEEGDGGRAYSSSLREACAREVEAILRREDDSAEEDGDDIDA
jgi:hypothetical protein